MRIRRLRWAWFIGTAFILLIQNAAGSSLSVHAIRLISGAPYYYPVQATVVTGQPIEWINQTASPHTVTHLGCMDGSGQCAFDSGTLAPGGRFSVYFLPPGRYPYRCRLHPIMEGMLTVQEPVHMTTIQAQRP
ncbi:MAG: hypothetical protein D6690_03140 [Nitrospirae bacterium]|nr:MAG: hypothetical protein D6690_03140 [Nitrospirota bacterium]